MGVVNIFPELITWRPDKQGFVHISIRFDYNRKRAANQNIDYKIRPEFWDASTKTVMKSHPDHEVLNLLLDQELAKHRTYFLNRKLMGRVINLDIVKRYASAGAGIDSFYDFAEWVFENKKLKDGRPYSEDSKRCYRDDLDKLKTFRPTLSFNELDGKLLSDFKVWLQTAYTKKDGKALNENSIWKVMKMLRMVYRVAIKEDIASDEGNPFKKFDVGSYQKDIDKIKFLELHEVEAIEKVLLDEGHKLQRLTVAIGWRFLAMCVSAMRISDAMYLNEAFFNDAGDLEFKPHKTRRHNNKAQVPIITDRQRRYLETAMQYPLPDTDHKSFRTTFNIHLKVIAAKAGIDINLTSHVGRHTMGAFLVDAGIEKPVAKAILGVKSDEVIETYLHLKQGKLKKEASKLRNVF
jgi:site-specific recombinase XerD